MPTEIMSADEFPTQKAPGKNAWVTRAWMAIVTWVRKEPAATQAIILAFIAIGIAFQWWHWSNSQTGAVIGISTALLGMFVRSQVTPLIQSTAIERRPVPSADTPKTATGQ